MRNILVFTRHHRPNAQWCLNFHEQTPMSSGGPGVAGLVDDETLYTAEQAERAVREARRSGLQVKTFTVTSVS